MGMDIESVASAMGHENIQMLIQTYGHDVKEGSKKAADLMGSALLNPEPKLEKQDVQKQVSTLPDNLPDDIRQLIEKLLVTYAPPAQR